MAIIRQLETKFGIGASYHRITAFNISYSNKKISLCVATYISKEARANFNQPIEEIDIEIPFGDFKSFLNVNPIERGYLWLKENVIGFEDAIDDFDVLEPVIEPVIDDGLNPNEN
jgi:hypothetical protein